jgi:fibronectin-binding autotransporter adhesin
VLLPVTRNVVVRNGSADIDAVLPGVLRGTSSLTKTNSGTLVLSANNTYSGGTNVMEGRLLVNNTPAAAGDSGTGTGPVSVTGTAVLGGTGTIAGAVTVDSGAHLAPGTSVASLDVGALTLNTGSILDFELGTDFGDLINVTLSDGLTINGSTLNLTAVSPIESGMTYTLIDYAGTLGGSVSNIALGTTPAGFDYQLIDNTSNTSIDLLVTAALPNDADFNDDAFIDAADYVVWRKFNPATGTGTDQTGDANGDGDVNDLDYDEWYENFGSPIPPGGGGSNSGGVPEPTTLALAAIAAMFTLQRRVGWKRK